MGPNVFHTAQDHMVKREKMTRMYHLCQGGFRPGWTSLSDSWAEQSSITRLLLRQSILRGCLSTA